MVDSDHPQFLRCIEGCEGCVDSAASRFSRWLTLSMQGQTLSPGAPADWLETSDEAYRPDWLGLGRYSGMLVHFV